MRRWQKAILIASCSLTAGLVLGRGAIVAWHWRWQHGNTPQAAHDLHAVRGYKAPLPAGASGGTIDSITCPSASHCVGIGSYTASATRFPVLVVTGAGSAWKATAVQLPANARSVGYNPLDLACPTRSTCIGVGSYLGPGGQRGLLVTGSGGSWEAAQAPLPRNASRTPDAALSAVACASAAVCAAIGSYTDAAGGGQGMLLARTRTSWSPLEVTANLNAVACAPHAMCVVVGSTYGRTAEDDEGAIATGTGASWKARIAPLPANAAAYPGAVLESVTCPTSRICVAAGYYTDTSGKQDGLLLTGYGTSWTATEAPHTGALSHVACSSPMACVAIGNSTLMLAAGAGNSWNAISVPLPKDAVKNANELNFYSASCGPTSTCVFAGYYVTTAKKEEGLIVTGSDGSWTATEVMLPPDGRNSISALLDSATCPFASTCIAVGSYNNYSSDQPLIGVYNILHSRPRFPWPWPPGWH